MNLINSDSLVLNCKIDRLVEIYVGLKCKHFLMLIFIINVLLYPYKNCIVQHMECLIFNTKSLDSNVE